MISFIHFVGKAVKWVKNVADLFAFVWFPTARFMPLKETPSGAAIQS